MNNERFRPGLITALAASALFLASPLQTQEIPALNCNANQQQVTHNILIDDHANDLKERPLYNPETGQNEILLPGGEGNLAKIQSVWNVGDETTGFFEYDLNTGTITSTSEASYPPTSYSMAQAAQTQALP